MGKVAKLDVPGNPTALAGVSNDAADSIEFSEPYAARITLHGTSDFLFHRWATAAVEEKAASRKNSKAKKTDNVDSYVWRCDDGTLAIPAEYLRQSIIHAGKFRQDPRSPRKSAMDLLKAAIITQEELASLGQTKWDYLDSRRVTVQRAGITRVRPAIRRGWKATFELGVLLPEYVDPDMLRDLVSMAGRLIGVGDFRPTFGRFAVDRFDTILLR